ncbi:hypothetical protein PSECIP111951_00130 [Pseudoalteromonas holothuriae]|uniref:Uncharacterized protein n=1 Tax=Pseudoalteromonas holothuriae TaxID=2963714 RepID=A0A9W4VSL2_9GAMM|nr:MULTISPECIES: hypothetical protein [unclassified Pseudoalteromonas]CAH9050143.1 hypothetical protein PSECIP111951_00130 [Pseudoalteromonas sp. CIP111951]CAH9052537.1 hypothetical protein PSECIP111854_00989 [Pseudoalteromonas sp. CIP111854]
MNQRLIIAFTWLTGGLFLCWAFTHGSIEVDTIEEVLWLCLSSTVVTLAAPQLNSKLLGAVAL